MFTDTFYQVTGAYGRSYSRLEDAQRDWNNGLDFRMLSGPGSYVNNADHIKFGGKRVVKITLGNGKWEILA